MHSRNHFVLTAVLIVVAAIRLDATEQPKTGDSNTPSSVSVLCVDHDGKPVTISKTSRN